MFFNFYEFIFAFLPITFFIYFYLNYKRLTVASKGFLVFSSLFFYSWWNIAYLPINFNSPYKALNIKDFWRRCHITLSRFFKEYIYISLGGNKKSSFRTYSNLGFKMWTWLSWLIFGFILILLFKNLMEKWEEFKINYKTLILTFICLTAGLLSLNKVSEFLYFNF